METVVFKKKIKEIRQNFHQAVISGRHSGKGKVVLLYQTRNKKPRYQGFMLSFSCNDPNQWYYLNRMWRRGPPVMIFSFLSSNEKVALYTGLLTPKRLRSKY